MQKWIIDEWRAAFDPGVIRRNATSSRQGFAELGTYAAPALADRGCG